jgi:hypothetical protein
MTVAILSKDADFLAVVAEHAARELAIDVRVFDAPEKIKILETQLIITTEPLPEKMSVPILVVDQKPVRLQELLEKIQNQLAKEEFALGDALFSVQQKTIVNGKKTISLTDKETQLLLLLLKNKAGAAKDVLLKEVWGVSNELESHTLETHVYRLRAKLKEAGVRATIEASPGIYRLIY